MTTPTTDNLGVQLGERLFELGVTADVCKFPHKLEHVRNGSGVLVVTDAKHRGLKPRMWGVAKPDMPWKQFLKEVLP